MVVASYGRSLGPWAVPGEVFGAMAVVVAATCIFAPGVVRLLLDRIKP